MMTSSKFGECGVNPGSINPGSINPEYQSGVSIRSINPEYQSKGLDEDVNTTAQEARMGFQQWLFFFVASAFCF